MSDKILIVEDDRDIAEVVARRLAKDGLECVVCGTGVEGLRRLSAARPRVLLCDLMLPDCPGEVLVRYATSAEPPVPTIVMSARGTTADKVDLLSLGADDYVSKPFDLEELAARVAVQLRRDASRSAPGARLLRVGRWGIDEGARIFTVGGGTVDLTRVEFDLILTMARRPKRVFTRPELFEAVWGQRYSDDAKTVNVHISNIRAKLRPTGTDGYIDTVWGVGFRVNPPAEEGSDR
ncbi:response regulator transcription factor [Paratractidigestivibacter sp.]|uniref:response regulator transcription factor n=1 Tax=Paratractidigestivibacter sp. TaxID=2847316 RepID=UPI002ABDD15C|nr:response regulator transcription factor [Paratractidigestivibacter sp.]